MTYFEGYFIKNLHRKGSSPVTIPSLLRAVFLTSPPARLLFPRSGLVAAIAFTAGDLILIARNGLTLSIEGLAGLLLLLGGIVYVFALRYPIATFRCAGGSLMAGSLLLAATGLQGETVDWWKAISPVLSMFVKGILVFFQDKIAGWSLRLAKASFPGVDLLRQILRYPVIWGASISATGLCGMMVSATQTDDWVFAVILLSWLVGEAGSAASDPRAQEAFKAARSKES